MPIDATEPTTLQATYPAWAISEFRATGDGCSAYGESSSDPVRLFVRLVKYRVRDDGLAERSPLPGDVRQFEISDLLTAAMSDENIANVVQTLTVAVATYATGQGML